MNDHRSMKRATTIISVFAVTLGVGGGMAAFQTLASAPHEVAPVSESVPTQTRTPVPTIVPGVVFAVAPCEPPAVLEDDECVTTVVQTIPAPATSNAPQSDDGAESDQVAQTGHPGDGEAGDDDHSDDHADESDEVDEHEAEHEDHGEDDGPED